MEEGGFCGEGRWVLVQLACQYEMVTQRKVGEGLIKRAVVRGLVKGC